ncbi:hypothetical protein IC229_12670 [Spirosoma sp. BT702]|uniref:DUF4440 domain-containing protein n=1 Tax=Spirosoma profusum TaxID=2771354 RepID=A0A926Y366_9BACT|nr:hypothetical protein [Spirosoma profusum]MBD2701496.1 hypothetical protein [Spirosoma profusum]
MKLYSAIRGALVFMLILHSSRLLAQNAKDSVAIQTIIQLEDQAWNKGDAQTYSQSFSSDGTFTNIGGMFF